MVVYEVVVGSGFEVAVQIQQLLAKSQARSSASVENRVLSSPVESHTNILNLLPP